MLLVLVRQRRLKYLVYMVHDRHQAPLSLSKFVPFVNLQERSIYTQVQDQTQLLLVFLVSNTISRSYSVW